VSYSVHFSPLLFDADPYIYSTDKYEEQRRHWGGGLRGNKSTQMMRKRAKAAGLDFKSAALGKL